MSDEDEIYIDEFLDQVENGDTNSLGSTLDQEDSNRDNDNLEGDINVETETQEQTNQISSDDLYKAIYQGYKDALQDIEEQKFSDLEKKSSDLEKKSSEQEVLVKNLPDSYSSSEVQFATGTDAKYYTVSTSGSISSADEQLVAYMVDTRNIVIIGFSIIILLQFYKIVKGTFLKFVKGRKDSI